MAALSRRYVNAHRRSLRPASGRRGFTLVELMVSTVITLILTAVVVQFFAFVTDAVFNSRAVMDMADQLRNTKHRLIQDLRGCTAPTTPPLDPSAGLGYFEYVEGPKVATSLGGDLGSYSDAADTIQTVINSTLTRTVNTVWGDTDDILMFTTCSFDTPFMGKATISGRPAGGKSRYAEVAWFLRKDANQPNCTLHRRVWLVAPELNFGASYAQADKSFRQAAGTLEPLAYPPDMNASSPTPITQTRFVVSNGLGDLTMRECRSVHQPYWYPYEMMYVSGTYGLQNANNKIVTSGGPTQWDVNPVPLATRIIALATTSTTAVFPAVLSLPSLNEQTHSQFPSPLNENAAGKQPWLATGNYTKFLPPQITTGTRIHEDVIMTNVVGFDVKAWDPGAPVFRALPAVDTTNVVGVVVPGDPGFNGDGRNNYPTGALQRFITSPTANRPVAFGAYADLNYMWAMSTTGNAIAMSMQRRTNYFNALNSLTTGTNAAKPPRPSFAFANAANFLSGYSNKFMYDVFERRYDVPWDTRFDNKAAPAVYDTWSTHYEYDGIDGDDDGIIDEGTDGIDNPTRPVPNPGVKPTAADLVYNGIVDEPPTPVDINGDGVIDEDEITAAATDPWFGERDAPPPYSAPLRGIKITIRAMEQDSRQVREVTIIHEFVPL